MPRGRDRGRGRGRGRGLRPRRCGSIHGHGRCYSNAHPMRVSKSLVLFSLLIACSSADAGSDAPSTCTRSVWKTTSSRIDIRSFQLFKGSSGYLHDRSLLTEAQLAALDGLCLIPTPTNLVADSMTYRITITDNDGTQTSYRATERIPRKPTSLRTRVSRSPATRSRSRSRSGPSRCRSRVRSRS